MKFSKFALIVILSFVFGYAHSASGFFATTQNHSAQTRDEKGPAYTSPPTGDLSYALMGEFQGMIKLTETDSGKRQSELLGLQIRTIGTDNFDAIAYRGGLPGFKNHQPEPIEMIGKRSGDFLILSGGPWVVVVEENRCRLIDRAGEKIGQLKRIRRKSPTLFATPPEGAMVLFDGSSTDHFSNGKMSAEGWLVEGADLKPMFQDFNLHVEFRLPYMPVADDQKRANSGLYLQSRYECQVLDSFAQVPKFNGCGSLYRFRKPDLNMCLPPLTWQTYDVQFTAPRWSADGTKYRNAHVTSWVNGVIVQNDVELPNKTGAGKEESPTLLPIRLQDHGDPVRFRNIWIVDRGLASGSFPVTPSKTEVKAAMKIESQKRKQRLKAARKKAAAEEESHPETPPDSEEQNSEEQAKAAEPTKAQEPTTVIK